MIISKVIRNNRRHITRADYNDTRPTLGSVNVTFPKLTSLQGRALLRLFPLGRTLSHRDFDSQSKSYRLAALVDKLRDKGWPIVNHDGVALTQDITNRFAVYTRYELFAEVTPELLERIRVFCSEVAAFETKSLTVGAL